MKLVGRLSFAHGRRKQLCVCGCDFFSSLRSSRLVIVQVWVFFPIPHDYSDVVGEWLILSKRNFKFDLGDVLLFPSVGLRHMMTGVPDPWLSTLAAGLKAEDEARDG